LFYPLINTQSLGKKLIYMPTCHSTNAIAMEMLKNDNVENGLIIITNEQTAGKGQRGNEWLTEPYKNLTFSVVMNLSFIDPACVFNLNMAVCTSILEAIKDNVGSKWEYFKAKWPNDIYFQNQKVGGLLIESLLKANKSFWAIIGIGLNVNQTEFGRLNATSLKNICSTHFDLVELLETIVLELEQNTQFNIISDFESLKINYLQELYRFNQLSDFKMIDGEMFEGKIIGIDKVGKIAIEKEGEILYFDKQELKYLR